MIRLILKRLSWYVLVPVVLLSFLFYWHINTYKTVEEMAPLKFSKNKEASREFLSAMTYAIHIHYLHKWVDYDNIMMIPFMLLKDYHFKQGKELLPKDSIEDVFLVGIDE